jgi:hypothetical protein
MIQGEERAAQALFTSVSADGTRWLFLIISDDSWAITRDDVWTAGGASDSASIAFGVQTFQSLTAPVVSPATCNATVRQHLDRIEVKGPLARGVPTAKASPGRTNRKDRPSACFTTPYRRP